MMTLADAEQEGHENAEDDADADADEKHGNDNVVCHIESKSFS